MDVEAPEERHVQQMMWLSEKVATLEKENEEMKRKILEMELRLAAQDEAKEEDVKRRVEMECAIVEIAEHLQKQSVLNESAITTVDGLVEEVKKRHCHYTRWRGSSRTTSSTSREAVQRHKRRRNTWC